MYKALVFRWEQEIERKVSQRAFPSTETQMENNDTESKC